MDRSVSDRDGDDGWGCGEGREENGGKKEGVERVTDMVGKIDVKENNKRCRRKGETTGGGQLKATNGKGESESKAKEKVLVWLPFRIHT